MSLKGEITVNGRFIRVAIVAALVGATVGLAAPGAGATAQTYTIKIDGQPPTGEPWAFLRFFPSSALSVHQGDVIDFSWDGTDTPHTATLVPAADAEAWRATNQGSGGAYASPIPESQVGGDDGEFIENPAEVFPSDPTCGTSASPCSFDGVNVTSSGFQFSNPAAQPSFSVSVDAPVGAYSFLCLLHPGMEVPLNVVAVSATVPTPDQVATKAAKQLKKAIKIDGAAADAQAQTVSVKQTTTGASRFLVSAGGFSNGTTANEYPDSPLRVHVGDKIRFSGTGEIHTTTFPKSAFKTTPFIFSVCEQPGADAPAQSPLDCSDPSKFQLVVNAKAIMPTTKRGLSDPTAFVNSGLLVPQVSFTFVAKRPGRYTFICLVHGPEMQGKVKVVA